jgi:hypothetical protein
VADNVLRRRGQIVFWVFQRYGLFILYSFNSFPALPFRPVRSGRIGQVKMMVTTLHPSAVLCFLFQGGKGGHQIDWKVVGNETASRAYTSSDTGRKITDEIDIADACRGISQSLLNSSHVKTVMNLPVWRGTASGKDKTS